MAKSITAVNSAADNMQTFIAKTNQAINAISTECLTANNDANGAVVTGNSFMIGIFGANTITVFNALRGGNVQTANVLTITSNVLVSETKLTVGNSTINAAINSTSLVFGNTTVNVTMNTTTMVIASVNTSTLIGVGANVHVNTSVLKIGNSTVNAIVNSLALNFGNLVVNSTTFAVGNSTVNALGNSSTLVIRSASGNGALTPTSLVLANSTVTFTLIKPSAAEVANGQYYLNANGVWSAVTIPEQTGANLATTTVVTTGTTAQLMDSHLLANVRSAEYTFQVKDNTANGYMAVKMFSYHFDGDVDYTLYGQMFSNALLGTFAANTNATHVRVYFTPVPSNTQVKFVKIPIEA
jgi:hypothetical protein